MEKMENWLTLIEYSTKYQVSVSTLRRRIRAEKVPFQLSDGKYLLPDEPPSQNKASKQKPDKNSAKPKNRLRPNASGKESIPLKGEASVSALEVPEIEDHSEPNESSHVEASSLLNSEKAVRGEFSFSSANQLLVELKKAYMLILQEKEEQLVRHKEEIADLKTLVRVLESENQRLNERLQQRFHEKNAN